MNLFDNDSQPLTGAITLEESAANFRRIAIYFRNNDNIYSSVEVLNPNGKIVTLQGSIATQGGMTVKVKCVRIDGTIIDTYNSQGGYWTGQAGISNTRFDFNGDNFVAITQVLGWR